MTLTSLSHAAPIATLDSTEISELSRLDDWAELASGVWRATVGNADAEIAYTSLAAEPPKLERINQLGSVSFPFGPEDIRYDISEDGKIMVRIPCDIDEQIYGFGLQLDRVNHTGKILDLKADHWGKGRTHAPVPFYLSSKGYGVFFNTARYITVHSKISNRKDATQRPPEVDRNPTPSQKDKQPGNWMGQPPADAVEVNLDAEGLEVIVFGGDSLLEIVQRYNLYSGGGALPPLWGLGFWHRVHAAHDESQVMDEFQQFVDNDCPLDVIGLEPGWQTASYPCTYEWQTERFPDPQAFTQNLLNEDVKVNLWVNPYVSQKAKLYEPLYPLSGSHMVWLGIVPDYTLEEAQDLLVAQHKAEHFDIGISGYKVDEVDGFDHWLWPDHAKFPSGTSAETMRQTYGMQLQQALYQKLFKANNQRTFGLVRASNGAASSLPFVLYSDSYNDEEYITGISSASLSGILWTPEVRSAKSPREWLNRMQTVCFSPMAKLNGWMSKTTPWHFPEVYPAVRETIQMRMQLLPYLYTAFATYKKDGVPPFRAMILEDGYKEEFKTVKGKLDGETNPYALGKVLSKSDQYMFGPSILVAPFYSKYPTKRSVRLPKGNWYDFYTGEFVGNNQTIKVTAEQLKDRIPLFVKEGAMIPMLVESVNRTSDARGKDLVVRHYGTEAGACAIYEDDATSFDYQKGEYRIRTVKVDDIGKMTVTVDGDGPALFGEVVELIPMTKASR